MKKKTKRMENYIYVSHSRCVGEDEIKQLGMYKQEMCTFMTTKKINQQKLID